MDGRGKWPRKLAQGQVRLKDATPEQKREHNRLGYPNYTLPKEKDD